MHPIGYRTLFVLLATATFCSADVLYVDASAPNGGDGSSWNQAYRYLADALAAADPNDVLHIAGAYDLRYYPDDGAGITPGDPAAAFVLPTNITLRGGFAGRRHDSPDHRNIYSYPTILVGDIDHNDPATFVPVGENSYHVVVADINTQSATLDGINILSGDARDSLASAPGGGGLRISQCNVTLKQCQINRNASAHGGGGVSIYNNATVEFIDCWLVDNTASAGAAVRIDDATATFTGCFFEKNLINVPPTDPNAAAGGAIYCGNTDFSGDGDGTSTVTIRRGTFWGNAAPRGGAISNIASTLHIEDSIFSGNHDGDTDNAYGGALYSTASDDVNVINCTLASNISDWGGGIYLADGSATLTNCILWENEATHGPAAYRNAGTLTVDYFNITDLAHLGAGVNHDHEIVGDPLFTRYPDIPSEDFGNLHILEDSPCINAGDPNRDYTGRTDIDDEDRVVAGCVDLGADECTNPAVPLLVVQGRLRYRSAGGDYRPAAYVTVDVYECGTHGYPQIILATGQTDADGLFYINEDLDGDPLTNVDSSTDEPCSTRDIRLGFECSDAAVIVYGTTGAVHWHPTDLMPNIAQDEFPADPLRTFDIDSASGHTDAEMFGLPAYFREMHRQFESWSDCNNVPQLGAYHPMAGYNYLPYVDRIELPAGCFPADNGGDYTAVRYFGCAMKDLVDGIDNPLPSDASNTTETDADIAFASGWAEFVMWAHQAGVGAPAANAETNNFWMGADFITDGRNSTANTGAVVPGAVASIFYDLIDAGGDDDDNVAGRGQELWNVFSSADPEVIWSPLGSSFYDAWMATFGAVHAASEIRAVREVFVDHGVPVFDDAYDDDVYALGSGNDTRDTAANLGMVTGVFIADELVVVDPDWYRFSIPEDADPALAVTIRYDQRRSDLTLTVLDADGAPVGTASTSLAGHHRTRRIDLADPSAQSYTILVEGAGGEGTAWSAPSPYTGDTCPSYTLSLINPYATESKYQLDRIEPAATPAGGPGFHLHLFGDRFENNIVVTWNGAPRVTNVLSPTHLTAWIPETDVAAPGTALICLQTTPPIANPACQTFTIVPTTNDLGSPDGGTGNGSDASTGPNDPGQTGQDTPEATPALVPCGAVPLASMWLAYVVLTRRRTRP